MLTTPPNFLRLRSFSFDAAILGAVKACEVRDGHLLIPVDDVLEAMRLIEHLADPATRVGVPVTLDVTIPAAAADVLVEMGEQLKATEAKLHAVMGTGGGAGEGAPATAAAPPAEKRTRAPRGEKKTTTEEKPVKLAETSAPLPEEKPAEPEKVPDEKPARTIADDVRAHEKAVDRGAVDAKVEEKPEVAETPSASDDNDDKADAASGETTSGFDEEYIAKAPKVRDIVVHLYERGLTTIPAIVEELSKRKDHPIVSKAVVTPSRVETMLAAVGIDIEAKGAAAE